MNDVFKDMQVKVGCDYLSDLPSYKRKVWQEMKRLKQYICRYGVKGTYPRSTYQNDFRV